MGHSVQGLELDVSRIVMLTAAVLLLKGWDLLLT